MSMYLQFTFICTEAIPYAGVVVMTSIIIAASVAVTLAVT